jgi:hypothetical protein
VGNIALRLLDGNIGNRTLNCRVVKEVSTIISSVISSSNIQSTTHVVSYILKEQVK